MQQELSSDAFVFTVRTDNAGVSGDNQFIVSTGSTGVTIPFLYDIETSDGQTITGLTGDTILTFPADGEYDIIIRGIFPYMYFGNGKDKDKLLDIKNFGIYGLGSTSQTGAFQGCSNLVISASDRGYFSSVTDFSFAWRDCSSLTSFPLLDTSSGTDFQQSWRDCSSLTSFPLLDTSNGTDFQQSWNRCTILASFPANAFDTNIATNYTNAFQTTNLTTQSIDDILVSLDTSGVINGTFVQSGGNTPSATGLAAKDSLVLKGWTITTTT